MAVPIASERRAPGSVRHHSGAGEAKDAARREGVPVRGDDHGGAVGGRLFEQVGDHRRVLGVQRRQRFVGEQHPRPGRQGPGDRDPLPLAGGQLVRICTPAMCELHRFQCLHRSPPDRAVGHLRIAHLEREDDVLEGVEPGQQPLLLEHERHVAAVVAQAAAPPPVESTSAHPELARVRPQLAVNEAKKCRLAGTAWARYLYQLTGGNAEVDALENGLATERFGDVDESDRRLDRDLAVGPRAAPDRPVLLPRLRALNVGAVLGRANAASCHWSASHPSGPD